MTDLASDMLLALKLQHKPWLHSVGTDASGRIVVHGTYSDKDAEAEVPVTWEGKQVLVHYAGAKLATRGKFTNIVSLSQSVASTALVDINVEDLDLAYLINELDRLEKRCGVGTLAEIFFEIHDRENAVTDR